MIMVFRGQSTIKFSSEWNPSIFNLSKLPLPASVRQGELACLCSLTLALWANAGNFAFFIDILISMLQHTTPTVQLF